MEESKNNKKIIVFAIVLLLIIVSIVTIFLWINKQEEVIETYISDSMSLKRYLGNDFYIINDDYSGEYDLQINYDRQKRETFEKKEVMTYNEYEAYCNEYGINKAYSDLSKNYVVYSQILYNAAHANVRLASMELKNNSVDLYIWRRGGGYVTSDIIYYLIIPIEKDINTVNVIDNLYTEEEFEEIRNPSYCGWWDMTADKPVIYLYPTEETEISVKLLNPERITCSYPKYIDIWKVLAKPNGDLIDLDTGRNLYSLYYESEVVGEVDSYEEGFVIAGEDTAKFLEEKLEILGLTEREAQEFIIYWLPKLESNKYNYIRFASKEEINNNMPLEIIPIPDTTIRVWMLFKGLDKPIKVEEQELLTVERNGFTVVEWGGTEIK